MTGWRAGLALLALVLACAATAGADEPVTGGGSPEPVAPATSDVPAPSGAGTDTPDADTGATEPAAPADATPADAAVTVPAEAPLPESPAATRIITLAPDLAELVYTAGAGAALVGTIDHSDHPPSAQSVPRVGDAFGLDFERIGALRPDLVLAWNGGTPLRWVEQLERLGLRVVSLGVRQLEDVARELAAIGRLTGHADVAQSAADEYLAQLKALRARYAGANPITVFFQISAQPLYTIGGKHAITAMIELCGGRNIFEDLPSLAADVATEAVLGRNPDVIIAGDDAGDGALDMWRRWPALDAVAHGDLYLVHADLVTRSSTRLVAGAEEICAALEGARAHGESRASSAAHPPVHRRGERSVPPAFASALAE